MSGEGLNYRPPSLSTSSMLYTFFSAPAATFPARNSTVSAVPSAYIRRPHTLWRNWNSTLDNVRVRVRFDSILFGLMGDGRVGRLDQVGRLL